MFLHPSHELHVFGFSKKKNAFKLVSFGGKKHEAQPGEKVTYSFIIIWHIWRKESSELTGIFVHPPVWGSKSSTSLLWHQQVNVAVCSVPGGWKRAENNHRLLSGGLASEHAPLVWQRLVVLVLWRFVHVAPHTWLVMLPAVLCFSRGSALQHGDGSGGRSVGLWWPRAAPQPLPAL